MLRDVLFLHHSELLLFSYIYLIRWSAGSRCIAGIRRPLQGACYDNFSHSRWMLQSNRWVVMWLAAWDIYPYWLLASSWIFLLCLCGYLQPQHCINRDSGLEIFSYFASSTHFHTLPLSHLLLYVFVLRVRVWHFLCVPILFWLLLGYL